MTNQPTPVILSDEALAEIEAHAASNTGPRFGYTYQLCLNVAALCQTVRALRAEREAAMKVLGPSMPESGLEDACRQLKQAYVAEADNSDTFEKEITALRGQITGLNTKLAQVAENLERPVRNVLETCLDEGDPNPKPLHDLAFVVAVKLGQTESRLAAAQVELRRWRNGDQLPEGWTCLDAGDGFPNLYLYSRADIVEQAKARLAQVEKERDDARQKLMRRCTHPNTYPLKEATRRCHDCGAEILL